MGECEANVSIVHVVAINRIYMHCFVIFVRVNDISVHHQSFKSILSQRIVFAAFVRFYGQNCFQIVFASISSLITELFKHLQAKILHQHVCH
jgi:hypothetical protein